MQRIPHKYYSLLKKTKSNAMAIVSEKYYTVMAVILKVTK